jgi:small redox-active disulfide protein 2
MSIAIKVLGTGCPKCKTMTSLVQDVVNENNIDATIEKVEDIMDIMTFNVMSTPALVINDVVTIKGRIPSKAEVLEILNETKSAKNTDGSCCSSDSCC